MKSEAASQQRKDLILLDLACKECGMDVKGYYSDRGKTCDDCIKKSRRVKEHKHYSINCIKCQVKFECDRSDRKYCNDCRKERSNLLKRFRRIKNPEKYRSAENEYKKITLMGRTTRLNSRARKYGQSNLGVDIIKQVFQIDNFTCVYCGKRGGKLTVDHMVPLHRGGGHEDSNLVTACFACNNRKRIKMPLNFICESIARLS
jgi:5-methylcytosine-specific restriction endonuclease McrA